MLADSNTILDSALALPEVQRAEIVVKLLDSLNGACAGDADPASHAYAAEVQRRSSELDSGEAEAEPWSEVRAKLRARLEGDA